jgi:hypothetical protein
MTYKAILFAGICMTTIPIDIDWETLILLLNRFREGILTRKDAEHLEYLLKKYYKKALLKGDTVLAKKLSYILIGLDGYLAWEISEDDYKRLSNVR